MHPNHENEVFHICQVNANASLRCIFPLFCPQDTGCARDSSKKSNTDYQITDMTGHEYIHDTAFDFEAGGSVGRLKVAYHTSERPYIPGNDPRKVIWICHALTANSDAGAWWPEFVGKGKLLDTEKYFVVCVNMLGSPYGSDGPSSPRPSAAGADGKAAGEAVPYYLDFPKVTVRDIVRACILVRKHLGISRIDLLIGGSIGGYQAMEWCIMEPEMISRAVLIACNARVTPWMTAYNESQRMAIEADGTFRACGSLEGGKAGLECARTIALISYRSYEGYNLTQSEPSEDTVFPERACSYQRYQGRKLSARFDAYSYWYLTWSVDSHNVGRGRGGVDAALSSIRAACTVVGIDSDCLFPVDEQRYLADRIPGARFHEINSRFGHDGFLLEYPQLTAVMAPLLEEMDRDGRI